MCNDCPQYYPQCSVLPELGHRREEQNNWGQLFYISRKQLGTIVLHLVERLP